MELISLWWPPAPTQRCALRILCWLTHVSNDQRYRWLNDVVRVGNDEVLRPDRLLIDIADLIWGATARRLRTDSAALTIDARTTVSSCRDARRTALSLHLQPSSIR